MKKNDDPSDDIETGKLPPYVEVYFENDLLYRGFLVDVVVEEHDKESSHYAVSCIHGEMLCVPLYDERWAVHHLGTGDDKPTPWQLAKKEFDILCTERTAYEMVSMGFFVGFFLGFFGMFFLGWMIF